MPSVLAPQNDGEIVMGLGSAYPPPLAPYQFPEQGICHATKDYMTGGEGYRIYVGLISFDTTVVPDGVIPTGISLVLDDSYALGGGDEANERSVLAEYFDWTGVPANDYTFILPTEPIFSKLVSEFNLGPLSIPLDDISGINNRGNTKMRFHISGDAPETLVGGGAGVKIASLWAGPAYLLINYRPPVHFSIRRPSLPPGSTGWYAYAQKQDEEGNEDITGRLFWRKSGGGHSALEGRDFPISPLTSEIEWTGDTVEARDPYGVELSPHQLPDENTTGIDPPDSAPDPPTTFGASRPGPGLKYVRVVDLVGNRRGFASAVRTIDIAFDEILRIIHRDHTNLLANGDNIELDTNGLPLDHTVVTTGGTARVEGRELVLETLSAQSGTTPSDALDPVEVDRTVEHAAWGWLKVREPRSGTRAGSVDIVLRELNGAGTVTDTVLFTYTEPGDYEYHRTLSPAGTTGSGVLAWQAGTVNAGLVIRFAGASKNLHARSSRVILKDHKHKFRWEGEPPDTEEHRPPGSQQQISNSPTVAPPPLTYPFPAPDRPKLVGTLRESVDFEAGMPVGWTQTTTGGGQVARVAGAALVGSFGLKLSDASTSSPNSRASFTKVFDSGGSHAAGLHRKIRPALLPNGKLTLGGIARPDGTLFIWPETGSVSEVTTLTIDGSPTDPGNFTVAPDGATGSVAVVATKQVETLSVSQAPSAAGTIALNVGGMRYNITTVGGAKEISQLALQAPRANGYLTVNLGGISHNILVNVTDTAAEAAERVAKTTFPGFSAEWKPPGQGYAGNVVTFTATEAGPQPDATYARGTSGTPGTITTLQQGVAETAAELADRIAALNFRPLWSVSHTPSSTTITLTAVQAGALAAPSVNWGTTGANGTISTTTPGAVDTPAALATRIRALTLSGWTISGSGAQVILTSNTAGWKRDLRINPASTGVLYHIDTQQGKNADLTGHYKDDSGTVYSRLLMSGLSTSTTYNVEATVEGAGTEDATIHFWGSIGSAVKDLLWRIENVSLVNYPAGMVDAGVSAEAAASETWEIHVDNIKVTDKGEAYFEEYNDAGETVGQFHHYGIPTQPVRDDIGIQEWREACVPGLQYAIAAKVRTDNVPASSPAKPVFITAHFDDGSIRNIGDVTGNAGISGTHDWYEPTPRLVIPAPGCYELGFQSRNLSSGEIVVQRVVMSEGSVPKRTRLYATSGEYIATLPVGSPYKARNIQWGYKRRLLGMVSAVPEGGALSALYRSAKTVELLSAETYQASEALVPDRAVIQAKIGFESEGTPETIPVLRAGSPFATYDLFLSGLPIATLLRSNGTEFDGGAVFAETLQWTASPEVAMDVAPGLHLRPQILSEDATSLPASPLYVFTQDAFREIVKEWYKPRVVETDGERITAVLSAEPAWERIAPLYEENGKKYSVWRMSLAWQEVLDRQPLI